jgi:hypothetical protein
MGTVKAILGFLAIIAVVIAGFQIAPPLLNNYSFQDDLRNVSMVSGGNPLKTDDEIRNDVLRRAKDRSLPVEAKQVTVERVNTPGLSAVYIAVDYSVPVNLPGYSFEMHFTPDTGNK